MPDSDAQMSAEKIRLISELLDWVRDPANQTTVEALSYAGDRAKMVDNLGGSPELRKTTFWREMTLYQAGKRPPAVGADILSFKPAI